MSRNIAPNPQWVESASVAPNVSIGVLVDDPNSTGRGVLTDTSTRDYVLVGASDAVLVDDGAGRASLETSGTEAFVISDDGVRVAVTDDADGDAITFLLAGRTALVDTNDRATVSNDASPEATIAITGGHGVVF